eukprot:scaffold99951_cov63-Phaeocystis_antarctica.AAC.1
MCAGATWRGGDNKPIWITKLCALCSHFIIFMTPQTPPQLYSTMFTSDAMRLRSIGYCARTPDRRVRTQAAAARAPPVLHRRHREATTRGLLLQPPRPRCTFREGENMRRHPNLELIKSLL